jgi:hypothetical protein
MNTQALRSKDIPFTGKPKDFRDFLRICAFRGRSAKDDFAKDLLNDLHASKFIDVMPFDSDGLIAYADELELGEEARALVREWRKLARGVAA